MIPLSRFVVASGDVELHLSPLVKGEPAQGELEPLPLEGAKGERDASWRPGSRQVIPLRFEEEESTWEFCEPLRLEENIEYEVAVILPLNRTRFGEMARHHNSEVFPFANERLSHALTIGKREGVSVLSDGRLKVLGRLKFDNALGTADLSLHPEIGTLLLRVEVTSSKLDYDNDFPYLLSALSQVNAELILSLDSPTEAELLAQPRGEPTPMTILLALRWLLQDNRLPLAAATITRNPLYRYQAHSRLETVAHVTSPDFVRLHSRPDECNWEPGGPLADVFRGFTPTTLPNRELEITVDVPENQYVKHALREIALLARQVSGKLPKTYKASKRWLFQQCEKLDETLCHPLWNEVSECDDVPFSMVMYERLGYRDFVQYFTVMSGTLEFNTSAGQVDPAGDLRPVWELFELWCYFELRGILSSITGEDGNPTMAKLLHTRDYEVGLRTGPDAGTKYEWTCDGKQVSIELFHTRKTKPFKSDSDNWEGSYSTEYKPDFSLHIICEQRAHWIHFDAKYRASFEQRKNQPALTGSGDGEDWIRWVRADDIAVMHTYRDAILGSRGCYVLYPGNTEVGPLYLRHGVAARRAGSTIPSVGAFPLCPTATTLLDSQRSEMASHLKQVISDIVAATGYQEEEGLLS